MKTLNNIELIAVAGGGGFSYAELAGTVAAGAVTGGLAGAAVGGIGAIPGAIAGAALAGSGYAANQLVQGVFNNDASWPGGRIEKMSSNGPGMTFCQLKGLPEGC
ncbi:hypothetical protein HF675_11800 [Serratia sp. JUb9]|uniref:hypothetical protein n=1 Tax=Serratia sp. JUb9 TaxID=2724469 RepID=UPI00164DF54A|nr:hypothetical protein [Serratia sp. JUb9]QNK34663.1 hypothetical protein HF675_11800 [Serratia sp. JUb9]